MLLALVTAFSLSAGAGAQDWAIDHAASRVSFETPGWAGPVTGEFEDFDARIILDPDDLARASIEARVDLTSLTLSEEKIRPAVLGRVGLHADAHPEAVFISSSISEEGRAYRVNGRLSLKGASRPAVLIFSVDRIGERAIVEGELVVTRTEYGIGGPEWGDFALQTAIRLHIEAEPS